MKRCNCSYHTPIGGPSDSEVECKKCGKKWMRHFGGSWDWQYKDCNDCESKEFAEKFWASLSPEEAAKFSESMKNWGKK